MARRGLTEPGRSPPGRDPWRDAPVSELQDQVLPRWFVLIAVAMVPAAIVVVVVALTARGSGEVPVAERRPPATATLTTGVGEYAVGRTPPQPVAAPCGMLDGIRVAGSNADRRILARGLGVLCGADLDSGAVEHLRAFAHAGGVVRFAQFSATGVDSTAHRDEPLILINARFAVTEPAWIAPLLVHDLTTLAGEPGTAQTALQARRAEATVCRELFGAAGEPGPSRACQDAQALVDLDEPLAALRAAGFGG